jgi:uncharacterized protein YndB with AHSA1/START domain
MSTSTSTFEIITPPEEPLIITHRFLKAPPALVFEVLTTPEHLRHWWGPRRLELSLCELDLRVGGTYHFVHRAPDGQEFSFRGEYRVIDPPHRLSNTFIWDGAPDHEAVETIELEAKDGGTWLTSTTVHDSVASRDMHVANGMEEGITDSYERMAELVARLQAA